ncbi:hypothetical protein [Marinobacter sp.]|uniref:hypothetical protein n=1 Tax=Marinobacter sp. TaxID=50741 RepID=UPI002355BFC2|nr:hypothetical protein [Marinobacter sp.]
MPLQKFLFKPGINKENTAYSNEGGWFDANLVRFRKGLPEKIGGWEKYSSSTFISKGRGIHAWVALDSTKYIGLGATQKYYVLQGTSYYDVTPIRKTTTNGVTFAATEGSSEITATDNSHGAVKNDFVTFSDAVSLGGNITASVLNQEYQITSKTANTYTFNAKDTSGNAVTANASDTGNGGSGVDGVYQINVGLDVYVPASGWGAGSWGLGTFGSVTALAESDQLRTWGHDNFGEDLIINVRNGGIYYWDTSGGLTNRAVALSDLAGANLAPTKSLQVLVSDVDRHVLCLGADPIENSSRTGVIDPMLIAFSDQESVTEWEPLPTNTAGSLRLSAGSSIIGGIRARQETLVWTDTALYSLSFIGQPFTFGLNLVNEGVGLAGPNAMVNTPKGVFWMDKKGFYNYSGSVQTLPCSVEAHVFDNIDETQAFQITAFSNKAFNEVGWFYCSQDQTSPNKYVVYNYLENVWSIGELSRTAWLDEGILDKPIATYTTSSTGVLYNHEVGYDDDGTAMQNVFIESSDFDIDPAGENFTAISRIIPDVKFIGDGSTGTAGQQLDFVLKKRDFPGQDLSTVTTANCFSNTTKIDTRLRARQVVLRVQSNDDNSAVTGMAFRLGATRLDIKPDGKR